MASSVPDSVGIGCGARLSTARIDLDTIERSNQCQSGRATPGYLFVRKSRAEAHAIQRPQAFNGDQRARNTCSIRCHSGSAPGYPSARRSNTDASMYAITDASGALRAVIPQHQI
jgi:hypothetical protein